MNQPLHKRLTKEVLLHLFTELELTDKEIGKRYGTDRTSITHLRKDYGIPNKMTVGRLGELYALRRLKEYGFDALDMNITDSLASFDILLDGHLRVEVKTSSMNKKKANYNFSFSEKASNGNKLSENRVRLKSGRTRKLYRKSCDVLLLVCWDCKSVYLIPSADIPDYQSTIKLSAGTKRYAKYKDNWELLSLPQLV